MAKSSTVISLPQMVDLALNSPEIGIVNFTVLHSLLHVIVQQLELSECSVEFRGSDSERLQNYISTAKPGPIITLTEYTVGPEGKEVIKKKGAKTGSDEKGKADEVQTEKAADDMHTIVVVEQNKNLEEKKSTPHFSVAITQDHFNSLQGDIDSLKDQVKELAELPTNIGLIDAIRTGKEKPSPVLDMFQILNITKRLDGMEVGLEKFATMVEDLAKESKGEGPLVQRGGAIPENVENRLVSLEHAMENLGVEFQIPVTTGTGPTEEKDDASSESAATDSKKKLKSRKSTDSQGSKDVGKKGSITKSSEDVKKKTGADVKSKSSAVIAQKIMEPIDLVGVELSEIPVNESIKIIQQEIERLRQICSNEFIEALKDIGNLKDALDNRDSDLPLEIRLNQVEEKLQDYLEQINTLDTAFTNQISLLQDNLSDVQREFGIMLEKINMGALTSGGGGGNDAGLGSSELYNKMVQMQDEINAVSDTTMKLWDERESRQGTMDIVAEQIELLKTVKVDKDEIEEALAEKADTCVLNRKVSHEEFEEVCENLNKNLEETINKLTEQGETWKQAMEEVQANLTEKIDKSELEPLKEFVNSRMKQMNDTIKALINMKTDTEAAGTKSKFLRNVNCLSCDKEVVMRKEIDASSYPKPSGIQPTKSMGPYLAYELDQLRKQQKCVKGGKNLNMIENALLGNKHDKADKDHICNRYCGGSHTTTTPQQRVTRIGHFLEQWGPEISPAADEVIKGTDGKMYKGRDEEILKKFASEKTKGDEKKSTSNVLGDTTPKSVNLAQENIESAALETLVNAGGDPNATIANTTKRASSASVAEGATKQPTDTGKRISTGSKATRGSKTSQKSTVDPISEEASPKTQASKAEVSAEGQQEESAPPMEEPEAPNNE